MTNNTLWTSKRIYHRDSYFIKPIILWEWAIWLSPVVFSISCLLHTQPPTFHWLLSCITNVSLTYRPFRFSSINSIKPKSTCKKLFTSTQKVFRLSITSLWFTFNPKNITTNPFNVSSILSPYCTSSWEFSPIRLNTSTKVSLCTTGTPKLTFIGRFITKTTKR